MEGVFITGVDTGVGKSTVCAGLLKLLQGSRKLCYWKPIQTNTLTSDDTQEVTRLTELPPDSYMEPLYRFAEPLSPWMAARKWGKTIEVSAIVKTYLDKKSQGYFPIIEGAGGLLVPFNDHELQIDLLKKLKMPVLYVAEDRVGAINQTLLTVNASREAKIDVLGVILTRSRRAFGNAESISHFGKVEILAELDQSEDARNVMAQVGGSARLRELFKIPGLPE